MLSERMLTGIVKNITKSHLIIDPTTEKFLPGPEPGRKYMLYLHVPFCEVLCPYCSFNRYPFRETTARPYFKNLRREMMMLKDMGYDFESLYFGGGTPTILLDELCRTIDMAGENFNIKEVACETNPNHLVDPWLSALSGRVNRLSVGVQSFNNELLTQMDRCKKYGSGEEILERIGNAASRFDSLNVDMIFNFPSQTEEILLDDIEKIKQCLPSDHVQPAVCFKRHNTQDGAVARHHGLQSRVRVLQDARRRPLRRRYPCIQARNRMDVQPLE